MGRRARGLTLVEVMIGSVVLSFIVMAIFLLVHRGGTTYATASRSESLTRGARVVLDRISEELRIANPDTLIFNSTSLSFQMSTGFAAGETIWGPTITYQYELSDVDANCNSVKDEGRLVRQQSGQTVRLCDYVKAGGFVVKKDGNKVSLTLTLEVAEEDTTKVHVDDKGVKTVVPKVQSIVLSTSVVLRNKSST